MQREWDHMWTKVWHIAGRVNQLQRVGDYILTIGVADTGTERDDITRRSVALLVPSTAAAMPALVSSRCAIHQHTSAKDH